MDQQTVPDEALSLRAILTLTVTRLIIDMTRRFVYPFVGPIASQLNVAASSVQNVLALQAGAGISSPLFGTLAEHFGHKRVMMGCLVMMLVASLIAIAAPSFTIFALVMMVWGLGKIIFNPTMQAYVGAIIPYNRRGRALGIIELSWAGSLFVAAPLAGFFLERSGLQALFVVFAVLLVTALLLMWRVLPRAKQPADHKPRSLNPLVGWRVLFRPHASAGRAALLYSLTLVAANELFFINYGLWMQDRFDLELVALGTVTIVVAVAEMVGEFVVIGLADRLGKRRLALFGALGAAVSYAVLPQLAYSLPIALVGLFFMFLCVETAIVASFPLFTEVLPTARTILMSANAGSHSLGRMVGAALGGAIFAATGDFVLIGTIALVVGAIAFLAMWRGITELSDAGATL